MLMQCGDIQDVMKVILKPSKKYGHVLKLIACFRKMFK